MAKVSDALFLFSVIIMVFFVLSVEYLLHHQRKREMSYIQQLMKNLGYTVKIKGNDIIATKTAITQIITIQDNCTSIRTTIQLAERYFFEVKPERPNPRQSINGVLTDITTNYQILANPSNKAYQFFESKEMVFAVGQIVKPNLPYTINVQQFKAEDTMLSIHSTVNTPIVNSNFYLDDIECLYNTLKDKTYLEPTKKEIKIYSCFSCGSALSFAGRICTSCDEHAPACVVCFVDPEPGESVLFLDCCKSYAHENHLLTWFDSNNQCPYCRTIMPNYKKVKEWG